MTNNIRRKRVLVEKLFEVEAFEEEAFEEGWHCRGDCWGVLTMVEWRLSSRRWIDRCMVYSQVNVVVFGVSP